VSAHRDHRPRADVLRQAAAAAGCSGPALDDTSRTLIAHTLRTTSAEPGEMTDAEWERAERIAAQAAAALAYDTARREVARASGWTHWPARAPSAPQWPGRDFLAS
jgi:hypothetical protein